MPTTSTTNTTAITTAATATNTVDMTTVATNQSELHTNAIPTENLIAGVGGHGNTAQPHPPANPQDVVVPALPPPPHVNRIHHNNMVTNVMLPTTRSPRVSPAPVDNTPRAPSRGTSPVHNADSNNEGEDLMHFESVSSQLIAAANQIPFPTHKLYPSNMLANEIPPLSAANQPHVHSSGGQASLFHSRVNAAATNSNPQTSEVDDLIVLDTLKATEMTKVKQKSLAVNNLTGLFERDMIVVDSNHPNSAVDDIPPHSSLVEKVTSVAMGNKSHPHPTGVMATNNFSSFGTVTSTAVGDKPHLHPTAVTATNHSSTVRIVTSTTMNDKSHPHPRGVTATNHSSTVGVVNSTMNDKKSHPHPRGVTATNSSTVTSTAVDDKRHPHPAGVVVDTVNQSAPANTNTHYSSPRQQLRSTPMASHRAPNQIPANQWSYRDGFGVIPADVLCVEAMQMWVKAEMSLAQGDMAVGLLAYQQASGERFMSQYSFYTYP